MQESFSNPAKAKIELEKSKAQVAAATDMKPAEKESLVQFLGAADQYFSSTTATEGGASPFSGPKIKQIPVSSEEIGPSSSYEITFPQGILWGLISVAASFSLSMVRERVGGTFLRLRVAPITRNQLLLGKALACFLSCAAVISLLLAVGAAIFHLRFSSPGLLLMAIGSSSAAFVGIMMLLSVLGKTEAAVSGSGWAVLMVMSMFGGGMVPVIMMPGWMQAIGSFSPVKWAILSFEGAIWRGFSFSEMLLPCGILVGVGVATFAAGSMVLGRTRE
jgi:ABC-2 type transport system permease protein